MNNNIFFLHNLIVKDALSIFKTYLPKPIYTIIYEYEKNKKPSSLSKKNSYTLVEHLCKTANGLNMHMIKYDMKIYNVYKTQKLPGNLNIFQFIGLFHDIGKPFTDTNCFLGHSEIGAKIVFDTFKSIIPIDVLHIICWNINFHMCIHTNVNIINILSKSITDFTKNYKILSMLKRADFEARLINNKFHKYRLIYYKPKIIDNFDGIIIYSSNTFIKRYETLLKKNFNAIELNLNNCDNILNKTKLIIVSDYKLYRKYIYLKSPNLLKIIFYDNSIKPVKLLSELCTSDKSYNNKAIFHIAYTVIDLMWYTLKDYCL
ncbi:ORF MSV040 hypothetical protein [Melanoplus sanguinipes entomopoxvirus]|uniref:HD domain-containing protein n=1 Tax=Melanoplus sanguinipes entomopoxvirus TaxID=83191 RepID=Q9YW52_MSEPV|nr:ORF MSV040 hypothetical protein [Melanoplus sanguinipes entomopoxvirus]AAC97834.1 ORF MSV040 hypothetical protein [Melanoplus sanguinipes entomopoxvirus 'O']